MPLRDYFKKRDFSKTPEPKGKTKNAGSGIFVVQKHAASHLHYDFRLELKGVLKSWAVPKGPSLDPKVKRLAVHVEDHPLAYANFEGTIPKGHYGAGTVELWDKGFWEPLDKNPYAAYKKGHLHFVLHGEKLQGLWDLVKLQDEKNWLLIKHSDEHAKAVLQKGLKASPFLSWVPPQLATLVDKPPEGSEWLHEVKFDGYRILAFKKKDKVVLQSRNHKDWTALLPAVAEAVKTLPQNVILDGEVVVLDKEGKSNFQLLQNAIANPQAYPLVYFIFDIIYYDSYDLRTCTLLERKGILQTLLQGASEVLRYSDHVIGEGPDVLARSCEYVLEGIVSKGCNSPYQSGRNKNWLKIKCLKGQEFVIGGYTKPAGSRSHFGALLLGVYNEAQQLEYVGRVGTGFNDKMLQDVHKQLIKNTTSKNPFTTKPPGIKNIEWVKPVLVAEVAFSEWTQEGRLRHPSFKGLRLDKKVSEIVREMPRGISQSSLVLTHPKKILYPEDKISKEDLLTYFDSVSDYILPYVALRPLTLLRCPTDYHHCFYQRHYNKTTPPTLHPIAIEKGSDKEPYIYLDDKPGLLSLVQMGVLEIHPWGSTLSDLDKPDMIIFDLDPGPEVSWQRLVAAALEVRDTLLQYNLQSFVKSTGGKGLHVVVPILPEYEWQAVKQFTHVFVQFLEQRKPKEYISTMSKAKRGGKIFIDYLRNQKTATAVSPYSPRARLHAVVSTPLFWDELGEQEDTTYTIHSLPKRLQALKKDPWENFWTQTQSLRLDKL